MSESREIPDSGTGGQKLPSFQDLHINHIKLTEGFDIGSEELMVKVGLSVLFLLLKLNK